MARLTSPLGLLTILVGVRLRGAAAEWPRIRLRGGAPSAADSANAGGPTEEEPPPGFQRIQYFTKRWPPSIAPDDSDERAKAKEMAIGAACDIYDEVGRLRSLYESADANRDGVLTMKELQNVQDGPILTDDPAVARKYRPTIRSLLMEFARPMAAKLRRELRKLDSVAAKFLADQVARSARDSVEGKLSPELRLKCDEIQFANENMEEEETAAEDKSASEQAALLQEAVEAREAAAEEGRELARARARERARAAEAAEMDAYFEHVEAMNGTALALKLSADERKVANELAWGAASKAIARMNGADFCWRDVWKRGSHARVCKRGYKQKGLLCYSNCPKGYSRFGDHCWGKCQRGWKTTALWCNKGGWKRRCKRVFGAKICAKTPWVKSKKRPVKYRPACTLVSGKCSGCPSKHYSHGALCYKKPAAYGKGDYACNKADTLCKRKCSPHLGTTCGAGCALDKVSCFTNTMSMIVASVQAVVQTALLVVSFGSSSGGAVMSGAARKAALNAAKKAARRNAKQAMKRAWMKNAKRVALKTVRKQLKKLVKKQLEEAKSQAMDAAKEAAFTAYATRGSQGMIDAYKTKAKAAGKNANLLSVAENLDSTGISGALRTTMDKDTTDNRKAAAWLEVMSNVDPTGILGAVAAFLSKDSCRSVMRKAEKEDNQVMSLPSLNSWTQELNVHRELTEEEWHKGWEDSMNERVWMPHEEAAAEAAAEKLAESLRRKAKKKGSRRSRRRPRGRSRRRSRRRRR